MSGIRHAWEPTPASHADAIATFAPTYGLPTSPLDIRSDEPRADHFAPETTWGSSPLRLSVDPLTGAARGIIPLPLSPGREGFTPELDLTYVSGRGNGPFGLGWALEMPIIERRTIPAPRYGTDEDDDDFFSLSGDLLVPALRDGASAADRFTVGDYVVQRYHRQIDTHWDRIERWRHTSSGVIHWRVTNSENVTSVFGSGERHRISDPADAIRTSHWLLAERYDDRGNVMAFDYKREDFDGLDLDVAHEAHRHNAEQPSPWRYLKRVSYGNRAPHSRDSWHFIVVFDYGDHDHDDPRVEALQSWPVRVDPFSSNRDGFEIRQWRRCERVLMFHHFDEVTTRPFLVRSLAFGYDATTSLSLMSTVTETGFTHRSATDVERVSLPPVTMTYSPVEYDIDVRVLDSDVVVNAFSDPKARARWVDLHQEGLPGVLLRDGENWLYARNLGDGRFALPEVVADVIEGEGEEVELSLRFAERSAVAAHEREYQPSTTLRTTGDVNQDDQYLGYFDFNGDGVDDAIVADDRVVRWYPSFGDEGFGDPIVLRLDPLDHVHAHRMHFEKEQSFHIADMTGDGTFDLVRVRSRQVCYWPNQGRGRYGAPISMAHPPFLGEDAGRRVLVVDVNGSGQSDLICIGDGELTFWENQGGNSWGDGRTVSAPGLHPDAYGLAAVDLFGDGTAVLTWIDRSSTDTLRYIAPLRSRLPRLLTAVANGRGLETRFAYGSSTKQWLTDRAKGGSWLTALPYPVHVVEAVEERDRPAEARRGARFAYHHGHFDTGEQRFVGFAYRERYDGCGALDDTELGLFPEEPTPSREGRTPVELTKTWHHTGAMFEDTELTVALKDAFFQDATLGRNRWLVGPQLPTKQSARDLPRSHQAMAGQLLRRERYLLDGPPLEEKPYSVEETTPWVRQLQRSRGAVPPAYAVGMNERVEIIYERSTANPRVHHCLTLSWGDHGTVVQSACIDYPPGVEAHVEQREPSILVREASYFHRDDSQTHYRVRVAVGERVWQLAPLALTGANHLYEARELRAALDDLRVVDPVLGGEGTCKRLIEHRRWRYWSNDRRQLLPIGDVESRALLAREERLALTEAAVSELYGAAAAEAFRFEGGYFADDQNWWAPGPTVAYDAALFYVPVTLLDALGREVRQSWNESALFVLRREDGFGNASFYDWHPRTLRVWRTADPNGNVTAWRFTPLGDVLSSAILGSDANPSGDVIVMGQREAVMGDNPTVIYLHDHDAWLERGQPTSVRERHRLAHGGRPTELRDTVVTFSGTGDVLHRAVRAADRWEVSALVRRESGRPTVLFPTFFTAGPYPVSEELERERNRCERRTYDGVGRVVRRDFADGTFMLRQFESWNTVTYDANDTVLDSRWYADRSSAGRGKAGDFAKRRAAGATEAMRAAALSASHARTPDAVYLDVRGRPAISRRMIATGVEQEEIRRYDALGRLVLAIDGRGNVTQDFTYDLLGNRLSSHFLDAGRYLTSWAATGEQLQRQDPNQHRLRFRYDSCGRLTHVVSSVPGKPDLLIERWIWGGGDVSILHSAEHNLIGRLHVRLSSLGAETFHHYDVYGTCERSTLQVLHEHDPRSPIDWSATSEVSRMDQLTAQLQGSDTPVLEDAPAVLFQQSNATGGVTATRGFDRVQVQYVRRAADDAVSSITLSADRVFGKHEVVSHVRYNADGVPLSFVFANGVEVQREYDELGRIAAITAQSASSDDDVVQQVVVTRDALGNAMSVSREDWGFDAFTYDGMSRLVRAESATADEGAAALAYQLDNNGNLLSVRRTSGAPAPLEDFRFGPSNRVSERHTKKGDDDEETTYRYDEAGNLTGGASDVELQWDERGHLVGVRNIDGTDVAYTFDAASQLRRRTVRRADGVTEESVFFGPFERHRIHNGDVLVRESYRVTASINGVPAVVGERTLHSHESEADAAVRYLLTDHLQSLTHELDESGKTITEHRYSPFGAVNRRSTEYSTKASLNLGFRGGLHDADTDLVVFKDRWYAPLLGRWTNAVSDELNPYVFEAANPQSD